MKLFWTMMLALGLALAGLNAEAAKRLGGGKSVGKQSSNVTQQAAPAQQGVSNTAAKPAVAPAAAPATPPKKPWGAMLGGLAAGLGLAWLAHSLGMGEAMGQFMMIALVVLVAMVAIGWFMRKRQSGQTQTASPFAFQGAGSGAPLSEPASYRPANVGNDASARPFERNGMFLDGSAATNSGSMIGSGLASSASWNIPADFDVNGFLQAAKSNYLTMQTAWDKSDIATLRAMMTDDMLAEIQSQLVERGTQPESAVSLTTSVEMLEAKLLGIEELDHGYMASIEFSGLQAEQPAEAPAAFREVWNMTKPKDGSRGWLVAGVQAL